MQKHSIVTMKLADLEPAPYNPRAISDSAMAGLRGSIEKFGVVELIVWNQRSGNIVGGHQRVRALQAIGEVEADVIVVDLAEIDEKSLNIALNSPSIAGEFTPDLFALLAQIQGEAPDLAELLRFGDLEKQMHHLLKQLSPAEGLTGQDDVPEPPEVTIAKPGDLWILGAHRLICGDSADHAVLARLMDGAKAALYNTDPPYGVGYDSTNHPQNSSDKAKGRKAGSQNKDWSGDYDDLDAWDHFGDRAEFEAFLTGVFKAALPHVEQKAAWYCWHASATADCFRRAWEAVGTRYHQTIVWVKPTFVLGFAMWNYRNEPCLMGWQQGHKPEALPVEDEHSNVWECGWEGGKARCTDNLHPTQKPTRLFELPMLKHTRPGAICLESFSGSGSQIIAAERLGRRCFAVEINPRFVDVAVLRWEQFTGQKAVRMEGATT